MEIKASGEENRVMIAKDRPCHPELTDLLGILQVHGVHPGAIAGRRGQRASNSEGGTRSSSSFAAVSSWGCKGKLLKSSGKPFKLEM